MTIRAVLRNGVIEPLQPLPAEWAEGKELVVEDSALAGADNLEAWAQELEAAATAVPAEEHDRFERALEEQERQSKDAVRREWGVT